MPLLNPFADLTSPQRHAFAAALAGWALDAFDFFLLVFAIRAIAKDFHTDVRAVSECIFWTLAMRPVGALLFGWLAERFGRRPVLMINIISYSVFELASAAAPNLRTLIVTRALFGVAMGGEWGVGAALALETLPAPNRGFFSGLLQEGYVIGYLLASIVFKFLFDRVGWRGMFVLGASPALLVFYIRRSVEESPTWVGGAACEARLAARDRSRGPGALPEAALLDLADGLLQRPEPRLAGPLSDLLAGAARIQRVDHRHDRDHLQRGCSMRRRLLRDVLRPDRQAPRDRAGRAPRAPDDPALGVLVDSTDVRPRRLRHAVHGARRVGDRPRPPERAFPASVRAILPGFAYQLGNLAMSKMAPFQAGIAEAHANDYASVLSWTVGTVGVVLAVVALLGREAKDATLSVA